jgi:hypothetical protein
MLITGISLIKPFLIFPICYNDLLLYEHLEFHVFIMSFILCELIVCVGGNEPKKNTFPALLDVKGDSKNTNDFTIDNCNMPAMGLPRVKTVETCSWFLVNHTFL